MSQSPAPSTRHKASTLWKYFLPRRAIVMGQPSSAFRGAPNTQAATLASAPVPAAARSLVVFATERLLSAPASELLDRMLEAIGLSRSDVQVIESGATADRAALEARILATGAAWAVCLGAEPARRLLGESAPGASAVTSAGFQVLATRHPEELIAQPSLKRGAWEDLKKLAQALGLQPAPLANRRN